MGRSLRRLQGIFSRSCCCLRGAQRAQQRRKPEVLCGRWRIRRGLLCCCNRRCGHFASNGAQKTCKSQAVLTPGQRVVLGCEVLAGTRRIRRLLCIRHWLSGRLPQPLKQLRRAVARAAEGVAGRLRCRPARAGRLRGGSEVAARHPGVCARAFAQWECLPPAIWGYGPRDPIEPGQELRLEWKASRALMASGAAGCDPNCSSQTR